MFNALFVLIVFMLTLNKDILHIDWPFGVKENITITEDNQVFTSFVFPYYSNELIVRLDSPLTFQDYTEQVLETKHYHMVLIFS